MSLPLGTGLVVTLMEDSLRDPPNKLQEAVSQTPLFMVRFDWAD